MTSGFALAGAVALWWVCTGAQWHSGTAPGPTGLGIGLAALGSYWGVAIRVVENGARMKWVPHEERGIGPIKLPLGSTRERKIKKREGKRWAD
jgi:hypothetical protein